MSKTFIIDKYNNIATYVNNEWTLNVMALLTTKHILISYQLLIQNLRTRLHNRRSNITC